MRNSIPELVKVPTGSPNEDKYPSHSQELFYSQEIGQWIEEMEKRVRPAAQLTYTGVVDIGGLTNNRA